MGLVWTSVFYAAIHNRLQMSSFASITLTLGRWDWSFNKGSCWDKAFEWSKRLNAWISCALSKFFLCNVICTYIMLANVCTAVVISLKINFILRNWRRAGKNEACQWHLMKELFWWFEEEKSFQLFTIVHLQEQVKHCSSITRYLDDRPIQPIYT